MSKNQKLQRTLSDELNEVMGSSQNDLLPSKSSGTSQSTIKKPLYVDEQGFQPIIPQMRKNQSHRQDDQQPVNSHTDNQYLKNWQAMGQNKVANLSYKYKKNYTELTEIEKRKYDIQVIQEEKIKSELKEIQIQLDQIQDKNSDEYKNILKIALQQLIQLIKIQPNRINAKNNNTKKTTTSNEENEVLKDGVEIDWIKDKGYSSLKSKKGLLSNVYNLGEKYAKQGLNLVEEAFLNEIDSKDLALKREEERQDDIWQKIIQRTCKTQVILNGQGVDKPTIQFMQQTTNTTLLKNPESYYDYLEKESVSFELHQSLGYFYIAEIISYICLNCRFYLIQKYSLDLGDNEFKPSGCFAIQTPIKQKFSSLSILMRGKVTYFFNHERNGKENILQMYKHTEDNKFGTVDIIKDYQILMSSDSEFKYEFMIDLSTYEKVKMKENDFLECQYILVTQQGQGTDENDPKTQIKIIQMKVYNFSYTDNPMLVKQKSSTEGKDDSVGFFKEISDKETRFFFYFQNKFQMYFDYDQKNPAEQPTASDTFRYQDESQFLNCHFKRWQAQAFRSTNYESKVQDINQTAEIIYFLVLDNKDQLSYVQLWSQPQDKKMKKHMEKFMQKIIQERNVARGLINKRVGEQLQGYSYFLLNNHKVITYNENQAIMHYLKDFSKAKNNGEYHEPSFNNLYLYQAPQENKLAYYSQQYACENANNCENKSLYLHKTKQKVMYSSHMIFVNSYDEPKSTRPVLTISKEWMFMDTRGDGNLSIIYLGDQNHAQPDNKYDCYWYHVSLASKIITLFLKRSLEMKFLQININQLEKSSLLNACIPLLHDQIETDFPEYLQIKTDFPEYLSEKKNIKAIQFELVTDPVRVEDDYIKFIAYLQNENDNKSNILGTPYFCRAQVLKLCVYGEINYQEIPLDIAFLNKFCPNRKQSQTLLFASCSPFFIKSRGVIEQSFQIGFSHYDERKFQDCIDIYEYQAVMTSSSIQLRLKKAYLIVGHKKMHQDEDQQGNSLQRQILVPIIDQNGEPSANQILFQGKKFENKRLEEDEESYGEYDDEDEYGEDDDDGNDDDDDGGGGDENEYGQEENEGGTSEHNQVSYILPLDQDNCNRYRTKIIKASYKHFGLKQRALFTVIATAIQLPLLKQGAFTEQEKYYLLNQSICNLLCMSEPTFGELFGEIYQQSDNHIQQIFQLRFINKGFNNFASNLKNKTFDQSDLNLIFKQLRQYDFNKQKTFVPGNSIIERSVKSLHLVGIYNVNILFDLQAGFSHQSLIEWGFECTNFPALVEIVKTIQKQKFHNLNRKMLLMVDLPQLMSDPKISMKEFLHRDMTPLAEEDEDKLVCMADLLEDIELPSISDKNREYFEINFTGFDDQKADILPKVLNTLNKSDLNEAEEVNFIIIDFFTTTLKLKIDVIKNRQAKNSTDYLKFFWGMQYKFVNCNEIFISGLICQRTDQEIFNYNIIQKIIERQEIKFSMLGTKYLWFFFTLGFYAPYVTTICLRHTYRNDFKGQGVAEYEGGKTALLSIYIMRGVAGFTQIFYWFLEFEEMSFSGMSYFESPSNIADFINPLLYFAHLAIGTIILEDDTQEYGTLDIINSYIEFLLIIVSSVKFLNLMKSFSDYQMLVEMLFQVIRQIIPLLFLYIFSLAAISFSQMVALGEYKLDWVDGKRYPDEYTLQPRVGFMFLQTLRNSMGDTKSPMGGVWKDQNWTLQQSFAFFLQWFIYIIAIFLINIIILNFLIIWVGEIYTQVKGGIPYYFQMQAEMNFNYLKSTRHIIRSQNKYNQIWIIKSPLNGLPDNISADQLEGLSDSLSKMQYKIKNKLYKKLEGQQKQLEQNIEKTKSELSTRLKDIEQTQKDILDLLQKQKR